MCAGRLWLQKQEYINALYTQVCMWKLTCSEAEPKQAAEQMAEINQITLAS